ncbi:MAG: LppX_LprAFG lipoprotein [Chloroflexi bacterium]|nr:LppX_LprAFG lipoprotein [Chloroflexota bacterium]
MGVRSNGRSERVVAGPLFVLSVVAAALTIACQTASPPEQVALPFASATPTTTAPIATSTPIPTPIPTPTPIPSPTPTPLPSAETLARRAVERMGRIRSAAFQIQADNGALDLGSGLMVESLKGTIARPDRLRLKATTTFNNNVVEVELIKVGTQLYLLNPFTQQWQPLPPGSSPLESLNPFSAADAFAQATDLTRVERVNVSGADTWHLRGTLSPGAVAVMVPDGGVSRGDRPLTAELWTGVQDDLPRQIRLEMESPAGTPQSVTIVLAEFDRPVAIEPPS